MFRYKLRTLLVLLALMPPVLAGAWWALSFLLAYPLVVNAFAIFVLSIAFGLVAMVATLAVAGLASVIDQK